ncbi:MFS transporter [Caballeronia terrestris]|uniref:MFS transporter n=1 Tax=Caballeronia terrestris TaxID=1226301 RepID=A0A158GS14_9BURK|nr:DUF2946 domain-containing protein [Caballeronia terrestris]SAL34868.1 MFS transporter [Caballeronia terrestris]
MRSRFHRKIGVMLGLLAILLATFAPVVSQTLAQSGHNAHSHSFCSAQPSPDEDASHHSSLHDGQACAYCHLLTHVPALPSALAVFAFTVWAIQHRIATRFENLRRVVTLTVAQPRAPPFAS